MADRDDFGAFLVGFVVGGLTGAVVALLFAPQSGEETRTLIKDKTIELRDKAAEEAEILAAKAEKLAADAKTKGIEVYEDVKSKSVETYENVKTRGKEAVDGVKKAVTKKKPAGEAPSG